MIDKETADLIRLAIFLYLVLLPGGVVLFYTLAIIGEYRERRRVRKILERKR